MDWFLHERDLRHERVKAEKIFQAFLTKPSYVIS